MKGKFAMTNDPGFYAFGANDGDHPHFTATAATPAKQFPELLLYDGNGNLVAIANGDASDRSSDVIDYTVPGGAHGAWTAEVTGSPSAPNPAKNHFPDTVAIQGATGTGPVTPK